MIKKKVQIGILALVFLSFFSVEAHAWANANYNNFENRILFTFNASAVTGNQTNFPVYVNLDDLPAGFFSSIQPNGSDILVVDSDDATNLSRQLVQITTTAQSGELWFRKPQLNNQSTNNTFYIYYNNPSITIINSTDVWNANYSSRHHLNELPTASAPQFRDSTSNNNNGTAFGMVASDRQLAQIYNGTNFDGVDNFIRVNNSASLNLTNFTIEGWLYVTAGSGATRGVLWKGVSGNDARTNYGLLINTTEGIDLFIGDGAVAQIVPSSALLPTNTMTHIAVTVNGSFVTWYFNGAVVNTVAQTRVPAFQSVNLSYGAYGDGSMFFFVGLEDEMSIINGSMSTSWINMEYNNQRNSSGFYSVGGIETNVVNGINITQVLNANGSAITGWNLKADNGTFQYFLTNQNAPLAIDFADLPQGNINITINATSFDNETLNFTVNATMGIVNASFTLWRLQEFRAQTPALATISTFNISFTNGTSPFTRQTTTGIMQVSLRGLALTTQNLTVSATGFGNVSDTLTFNTSSTINKTYTLSAAGISITVFDERNTSVQLVFDVTFSNGTCSATFTNQFNFARNTTELCIGENTITISNSSYETRNYFLTISIDANLSLTAYLLGNLEGIDYSIVVLTFQDSPIEGALVDVRRNFNGTFVTVAQATSDTAGTTNFFLDPTTTYQVVVTADNYVSAVFTLNPSVVNPITYVRLRFSGTTGAQILNLTTTFQNISFSIFDTPDQTYHESAFNITYFISSSNNDLQLIGVNIYYRNFTTLTANRTLVFTQTLNSSPSGATIVYTTNNSVGYYTVEAFFQKSGFERYNISEVTFTWVYDTGFQGFDISNSGYDTGTFQIIGLFVLIMVIGFFSRFGGVAALVAGFVTLGIMTFGMGIYPITWTALAYIVVIALIILGGGI